MKKIIICIVLLSFMLWFGCELPTPTPEKITLTPEQLQNSFLRKVVAIGNSLTAGYQSSGLVRSFQENSYPYLIAKQMGISWRFAMPWIEEPGIGSTELSDTNYVAGPLRMTPTGPAVVDSTLADQVEELLSNAKLPRPYDNLAVPGADLNDVLNTKISITNPFFRIVLRNPELGNLTMLEQALLLNPSLILLWIGNNDVLGAAIDGGDLTQITSQEDFQTRLETILSTIREKSSAQIVMANIPYVTDIPYVNALDGIFMDFGQLGKLPVVFDENFQPVDFDPDTAAGAVLYLPLKMEETGVAHLLLPYLTAYKKGIGVPDSAFIADFLIQLGVDAAVAAVQAGQIVQGMIASGLNPTGIPIPGNLSLTADETQSIRDAVDGFNNIINTLAQTYQVPIVDANTMLTTLNTSGIDGYTGKYVLFDLENTAFSLDGVHPNNGGYALIANEFIEVINKSFGQAIGLEIPPVNTAQFKGQYLKELQGYSGKIRITEAAERALEGVKHLFVKGDTK
ncbi:MAG: hypothetical protein GXO78_07170 [Calditrichaeota bacterium]|nr:hypothetical protein [Calditrichota bacterium]